MENINIPKEKIMKAKNIIIFILLLLWMIMPILQTIKLTNTFIETTNVYFTLMKIIAIVGITTGIITIYNKIKETDDKKQVLKELLPIGIFVVYMCWTLISCFRAPRKEQAFHGNSYRKEGYFMYINYAGFFFCAFLLDNKKLRKTLLNAFLITSIFLLSINRICLGGKRFTNIFENTQLGESVFHQFNHYGYYLMMSMVCALGLFIQEKNKILKILYLIAYTLIGYALIYNDTFGCYLAISIFLIMYGIYAIIKKTDRKVILIAIGVFILLSVVTFKDNINLSYRNLSKFFDDINIMVCKVFNIEIEGEEGEEELQEKFDKVGTNRMKLWVLGIEFALERPVFGYGPDNLKSFYLMERVDQDRPHNLIIYLSCVSGFPGMIIYVIAVGIIVIKGIKKLFETNKQGTIYLIVVITYLISSMFGNSMYYTSPYFFIFLGNLMYYNLQDKQ